MYISFQLVRVARKEKAEGRTEQGERSGWEEAQGRSEGARAARGQKQQAKAGWEGLACLRTSKEVSAGFGGQGCEVAHRVKGSFCCCAESRTGGQGHDCGDPGRCDSGLGQRPLWTVHRLCRQSPQNLPGLWCEP